jgi:hypothetical protein
MLSAFWPSLFLRRHIQVVYFHMEVTLKKKFLLMRLLLDCVGESHYRIADALDMSPCNLSKLSAGLTKRPKSLEKAAAYFSERLGIKCDATLLQVELGPRELIAAAHWSIENQKRAVA